MREQKKANLEAIRNGWRNSSCEMPLTPQKRRTCFQNLSVHRRHRRRTWCVSVFFFFLVCLSLTWMLGSNLAKAPSFFADPSNEGYNCNKTWHPLPNYYRTGVLRPSTFRWFGGISYRAGTSFIALFRILSFHLAATGPTQAIQLCRF